MIHPLLTQGRFLFVVDGCPRCVIWKEIIEQVNSELKIGKEVIVIDATRYHEFGIIEDERLKLFMPYVRGEYPVLFIEGRRKDGTHTKIEAEAWIRARLFEDFEESPGNEWLPTIQQYALFNKNCKYGERGAFKKKLICE